MIISDLSVGSRIKAIRTFRGMTQKELGIACGISANADVRVRHWEMGKAIPKDNMRYILSEKLMVSPYALSDFRNMSATEITVLLFWLDEMSAIDLVDFSANWDYTSDWIYRAAFNRAEHDIHTPTGLVFKHPIISDALKELSERKKEVLDGVITPDQYTNWKLLWPHSEDQWIGSDTYYDWRTCGLRDDQIK